MEVHCVMTKHFLLHWSQAVKYVSIVLIQLTIILVDMPATLQ